MLREESIKKIDEFLKYLGGVISVYDLYPVGHPVIRAKAEKAYVALRDIFKEMRDVNLILVGEDMVFENVILEASSSLTKLIRGLSSCGIE
ncbi:TPA: hypothetical protein DCX15_03245, partial [bacterium]|nr:hypothetical protein [bacterium]